MYLVSRQIKPNVDAKGGRCSYFIEMDRCLPHLKTRTKGSRLIKYMDLEVHLLGIFSIDVLQCPDFFSTVVLIPILYGRLLLQRRQAKVIYRKS